MADERIKTAASERFAQYLREHRLRRTPERFAVLGRVLDMAGHFSVDEFHTEMERGGYHVSAVTVYSTFRLLCEAGLLRRHEFGDNVGRYECTRTGAGVTHLVCTICGRVREVRDKYVGLVVSHRRYTSFAASHFALYVYGVCSKCSRKK